eukprot:TRINITY_DN4949_c0_g1_i1.p1 TRINITY_DN4949_c0_g1~~TRINITY_DN4949_c0_g1_i1.p1  ORF type:complete len:120 (+),score=30.56 TRINITY_DN4949_c0_g1_i1:277-636(+)
MAFQSNMFASHILDSRAVLSQPNSTAYITNKWVFDIGGSAALPFLRQILVANVAKLTSAGMGLQSRVNGFCAHQNIVLDVYYFSESAFRIVVDYQPAANVCQLVDTIGRSSETAKAHRG